VGFGSEAGYKDVDSANVALQIRANDSRTVLLTLPRQSFAPGKAYTFIIMDKGQTGRQLDVITVEDDVAPSGRMINPGDSTAAHRDSAKSY